MEFPATIGLFRIVVMRVASGNGDRLVCRGDQIDNVLGWKFLKGGMHQIQLSVCSEIE